MAEERFSDLGRVEAIAKLYEGTPFKPYKTCFFETSGKSSTWYTSLSDIWAINA